MGVRSVEGIAQSSASVLEDGRVHPGYHLASVGFAEIRIVLHHFVP
jgi:hypothetical protein